MKESPVYAYYQKGCLEKDIWKEGEFRKIRFQGRAECKKHLQPFDYTKSYIELAQRKSDVLVHAIGRYGISGLSDPYASV